MRDGTAYRYIEHSSPFGSFAVLWAAGDPDAVIRGILLPSGRLRESIETDYPGAEPGDHPSATALAGDIAAALGGDAVVFPLDRVALERCGRFQQRVLRAEHAIPRGKVSSYGRIAACIGSPGGARAVGRALATNPFPIVVPCHRAIRSDGSLGGFQGGQEMKRALLALEGVEVSPGGRVVRPRFHYGERGRDA